MAMPPERLLSPQEQTFKMALSAYPPITSALPSKADIPSPSELRPHYL
jgi:hypothetical protein